MSLPEVEKAVREWQAEDELAQSPGFCRRSANEMLRVARTANVTAPHAQVELVVWPEANASTGVHYALRASSGEQILIFNPVGVAQFPQYNGSLKDAPGKLREMKRTPRVV